MIQCNQTITALNFKSLIVSNFHAYLQAMHARRVKTLIFLFLRALILIVHPQSPHKIFLCCSYVNM